MRTFQISIVSFASIIGIETFEWLEKMPMIMKFTGQSIIGILTIIFIFKKIQILNDLRKIKENEKNISID